MLVLSKVLFLLTIIAGFICSRANKKKNIKTIYVVLCGIFLSVWAAFAFVDGNNPQHKENTVFFISFIHSIQVMLAGFEFEKLYSVFNADANTYVYYSFLFAVSPVCTFGFVLSFFEKFTSWLKCILKGWRNVYVISDVNEKSYVLSKSVIDKDKKALVILLCNNKNEYTDELKRLGAVTFYKNIKKFSLGFVWKKSKLSFFIMGDDESANLDKALAIIEKFRQRENTQLYLLSSSKVGGMLIDTAEKGNLKVRRINECMKLAYSEIDNFTPEKTIIPENTNKISVLIVGMGGYGTEFLKSVIWCGQLPGYTLEINVVDKNENIESVFEEMCPEIIEKNGNTDMGESCYNLKFFPGIDVDTQNFQEVINSVKDTTLAFISLGDDDRNIDTAILLRAHMARNNVFPVIKAVVLNGEKNKLLKERNLRNYKEQPYNIQFTGNVNDIFSYESVIDERMENMSLKHHLSYAKGEAERKAEQNNGNFETIWQEEKKKAISAFNGHEYFRNASLASSIYRTYFQNKSEEISKETLAVYEHMRWNAYMRTEDYVYGEKCDHLAKTHSDLVHFKELSGEDVKKDIKMVETEI